MADQKTSILITAEDRATAALRSVQTSLGGLSATATRVIPQLSALTSAFTVGGIAAFAKQSIDAADALNDMADRTGLTVRNLSEWQLAIKLGDATMDGMAKGLRNLSIYLVENGDKLRAAGITAKDARGAFLQLADLFKALPEGPERAALANEIFKKSGDELLPVLLRGSAALEESATKSRDYARAMDELAPKAAAFNDTLDEIALNLKSASLNALNPYMDGLVRMAGLFNEATQSATGLKKLLAELQSLTGSGKFSVFDVASRGVDAAYLMGFGGDASRRSASGRIGGPMLPGGNTPDEIAALARARQVTRGKTGGTSKTKTQEIIDALGSGTYMTRDKETAQAIKESFDFENWAWGEIAKDRGDAAKAAEKYDEALRKAAESLYAATDAGKFDEMNKSLAKVKEAFDAGYLSEDQVAAIEDNLKRVKEGGKDAFSELQQAVEGWGKQAANAFADFAISGKGSISDLMNHMAREFIAMETYPLFRDLMKGGADWFRGLFTSNATGGVYSGAGISAFSGQVVSKPTLFPFASGIGLMGEAGPEAILPLKRSSDGRLGVEGGGSNVQVNIIEAPGQGGKTAQRNQGGVNVIDVYVEQIESRFAGNISAGRGPISAAISNTFGLNRAAGAY